jgi:hypothetical protein
VGPHRFTVFDDRVSRRMFDPKNKDVMRRWRNSRKMLKVDHTGDMRSACKIMLSESKGIRYVHRYILYLK